MATIKKNRKIILNLAISIDGYIARADGSFDWITGDGSGTRLTDSFFNFPTFMENIDTVIMGKQAYMDNPEEGMKMLESKTILVATHNQIENTPTHVKVISGDICQQVAQIQQEDGKDIWLFGGAGVADQFIKADMVDEYIIGIIPIILGAGKRMFLDDNPLIHLSLEECTAEDGVTILRYTKRNT